MLYFRLRGLSTEILPRLWILTRRDLELCIYRSLTYAGTVDVIREAHIMPNRNISESLFVIKDRKDLQEQGLSGYSAAPLTSSAPLRLGKCQLSWVGLGFRCFWLLVC